MKNIQDIITCREITKLSNQELFGLEYECWNVSLPVWGDQVETLLENGYMVSMLNDGMITINKQLNPSPKKVQENKNFWRELEQQILKEVTK